MKDNNAKLALGMAFLAIALILMCIGIRWLFFLGFGLAGVSTAFSLRRRTRVGPLGRLAWWLSRIGGVLFILWLSSFGSEPMPWFAAAAVMFVVGMTEVRCWRANRSAA